MDSQKYYKKYLKYKSKYYYLKYGGAGADENPLKYPTADRENLIKEIKTNTGFFENMKNKMQVRGSKEILLPDKPWGNDPNRYTTEFLQKVVFQMRRAKYATGEDKTPKVSSSGSLLPKSTEREDLIKVMKLYKYLFESEAKKK